ncbi:MAG TPA: lamin tail domain-containing protein [Candidatus Pacearchaeota archaeon]|nr:lamin tail domain-containing protein [Candidatus Pacearchaeota archaeon]HRU20895.1 lamin tail domain-containing protein [Candidatus Paceibacterota bacterium]
MSQSSKIFILILFLFTPILTYAEGPLIVFNEICWMGDKTKTSNEWIELYNNQPFDISLSGWVLKIDDTAVELKGTIPARGFYLISRDKTKPADLYFNKALRNTGNQLILLDAQKNIIDQMDWTKGWPAGDNKTKQTMERINSQSSSALKENWQTSAFENGTPKYKNSDKHPINQSEKNNDNSNVNVAENIATANGKNTESLGLNSNSQSGSSKNFSFSTKSLLTGLVIALLSGLLIVLLKKSIKQT